MFNHALIAFVDKMAVMFEIIGQEDPGLLHYLLTCNSTITLEVGYDREYSYLIFFPVGTLNYFLTKG